MNLVNAAVIGFVGFFVLLLVFWYAVEVRGDEEVGVDGLEAAWTNEGEALAFTGTLDNPRRSDVTVTGYTYTLRLGDEVVARGNESLDATLRPGDALPLNWTVPLPDGFPNTWWHALADTQGRARIELEGEALVQRTGGDSAVPFTWSSGAVQGPDASLEGLRSCPAAGEPVCVKDTASGWKDGDLALVLRFQAPREQPALVHGGTARLLWQGTEVASALVPRTLVDKGDTAETGVKLVPSSATLASWWPAHLARCETTAVALGLAVTVEHIPPEGQPAQGTPTAHGTEVKEVAWQLQGPPFVTSMACRP